MVDRLVAVLVFSHHEGGLEPINRGCDRLRLCVRERVPLHQVLLNRSTPQHASGD